MSALWWIVGRIAVRPYAVHQRQQPAEQRRARQRQMGQAEQDQEAEAFGNVEVGGERALPAQREQPAQPAAERRQQRRQQAVARLIEERGAEAVDHHHQQQIERELHQVIGDDQRGSQRRIAIGDEMPDHLTGQQVGQKHQRHAVLRLRRVEQVEIPDAARAQPHLAEVGIAVLNPEQRAAEAPVFALRRLPLLRPRQQIGRGGEDGDGERQQQEIAPLAASHSLTVLGARAFAEYLVEDFRLDQVLQRPVTD